MCYRVHFALIQPFICSRKALPLWVPSCRDEPDTVPRVISFSLTDGIGGPAHDPQATLDTGERLLTDTYDVLKEVVNQDVLHRGHYQPPRRRAFYPPASFLAHQS